jgi:hypothetical protein
MVAARPLPFHYELPLEDDQVHEFGRGVVPAVSSDGSVAATAGSEVAMARSGIDGGR